MKVYYSYERNIKLQEDVKSLIRLEKKRLRKATIERIREKGRLAIILGRLKGNEETVSNSESER